ncbi:hypothetical protein JCM8208_004504 [Rhodotorula glutinis]
MPALSSSPAAPLHASATCAPAPAPSSDRAALEYFEEERLIISFDVGNTSTSVTLAHLTWASRPLAPASSTLRTVLSYPYSSPSLTPMPCRTPSLAAFDRSDRPRAFGAECLTASALALARDEGWLVVKGFKEQMRPGPPRAPQGPPAAHEGGKKLLKKLRAPLLSSSTSASSTAHLVPPVSPATATSSARNSVRSLASSEGLVDAASSPVAPPTSSAHATDDSYVLVSPAMGGIDGGTGALGDLGSRRSSSLPLQHLDRAKAAPAPSSTSHSHKLHHGPRLRTIYAAYLPWLVACARAWHAETFAGGDDTFVRCWDRARFVFAIPADWTADETDIVRGAMEDARLLPANFEVGRLTFVKEPAAITFFAARHTRSTTWLEEGSSFALVDAAEQGVSIIGYTVSARAPRLKLRAFEPVTRLPAGAGAVLGAVTELLTSRLARTKFKSPAILSHLVAEFSAKVLKRFSGVGGPAEYRLRLPEGDAKLEKAVDSGARIRDGWLTLCAHDVEGCFRPAVDAIVVRLSSVLPRGDAKHILLSGGFSESPYLVSRLREAFSPGGIQLVIPDIPTHSAVADGALAFYLSETLAPRRTRFALGTQVAVDWSTQWERGMHERGVVQGSGGRRLVVGKWSELVPQDSTLSTSTTWRRTFNFRYRLSARDPTFKTTLWRYDSAVDEAQDRWMVDVDGKTHSAYCEVREVEADLLSLVAASEVYGEDEAAWVQLQVDLVVYVGEDSLEAAVEWEDQGETVRGPATRIPLDAF